MRTYVEFLNNGSATLRIGKYMHCYDDMTPLADDIKALWTERNTRGWDGNEYNELIKDEGFVDTITLDFMHPSFIVELVRHGNSWLNCKYLACALLKIESYEI